MRKNFCRSIDEKSCLIGDALGVSSLPLNNPHESDSRLEGNINESNEEHAQSSKDKDIPYERLLKECDKELYPGCKYSNLSFTLHFYHVKCIGGISNKCFSMLLELFRDAFPHLTSLPIVKLHARPKKLTTDLGLGYKKIHACPKDCMLYWGTRKDQQSCHICKAQRYKSSIGLENNMNLNEANNIVEDGEQEMDYTEDELLQALDLIEAPEYFMDHQWQMYKSHLKTPAAKKMSLNGKRARGGQVHIHTKTGAFIVLHGER
ncbi:hypothetical protein Tco_0072972 [Tanacetum coccineum]